VAYNKIKSALKAPAKTVVTTPPKSTTKNKKEEEDITSQTVEVPPEVNQIISKLISGDKVDMDYNIVEELEKLGEPVIEALLNTKNYYNSNDSRVLGLLGEHAIQLILSKLNSKSEKMRNSAVTHLYFIASYGLMTLEEEVISVLIDRVLKDDSSLVRQYAAKTLGELENPQAVPALIKGLQDKNDGTFSECIVALAKINTPDGVEAAIDQAITVLQRGGERRKYSAASALDYSMFGERPSASKAVSALINVLGDPKNHTRSSAVRALGHIRAVRAVPALSKALMDEDADVRCAAANSLGKIGKPAFESIPTLVKTLYDENDKVRNAAANALGMIAKPASESIPTLVKTLYDENVNVRNAAANALGKFGPNAKEAVEDLISTLKDKTVMCSSARALSKIGTSVAIEAAETAMIQALEYYSIQTEAAEILGEIGIPAGVKAAVTAMIRLLSDTDAKKDVRVKAAKALSKIGAAVDAIPTLIQQLEGDSDLKIVAARILVTIGTASEVEIALPILIDALDNKTKFGLSYNWTVCEIIRCLEKLGAPAKKAIPELDKLLKDKYKKVRIAASKAISTIEKDQETPKVPMVNPEIQTTSSIQNFTPSTPSTSVVIQNSEPTQNPPQLIQTSRNDIQDIISDNNNNIVSTPTDNLQSHYSRIMDVGNENLKFLSPISGMKNIPILNLSECIKNIPVPEIDSFAWISNMFASSMESIPNGITNDQAAAINLYTRAWTEGPQHSLYYILNQALRTENRAQSKPFFPYLKLLLTAMKALPTYNGIVWRGVKGDIHKSYIKDKDIIWWGFSSCTTNMDALKIFLGKEERTLFCIETSSAVDIMEFSEFKQESEVLLPPGTFLKVKNKFDTGGGLVIVEMKELKPPFSIIDA